MFDLPEALRGVREYKIEVAPIACLNCGAIYLHAIPVLERDRGADDSAVASEAPAND
jgi:hypothetical protein